MNATWLIVQCNWICQKCLMCFWGNMWWTIWTCIHSMNYCNLPDSISSESILNSDQTCKSDLFRSVKSYLRQSIANEWSGYFFHGHKWISHVHFSTEDSTNHSLCYISYRIQHNVLSNSRFWRWYTNHFMAVTVTSHFPESSSKALA